MNTKYYLLELEPTRGPKLPHFEAHDIDIEFHCAPYYSDAVNKKAEKLLEALKPMINQIGSINQ